MPLPGQQDRKNASRTFNSHPFLPIVCSCRRSQPSPVADVEIGSGSLDISVAYHGFPIYSQSQDLCEQTDCPVKKGPVKVALEEPFPIITPPVGSCTCSISWLWQPALS